MSTPGTRPSKALNAPLLGNEPGRNYRDNQGSIDTFDNDSVGNKGSDSNNDSKFDVSDIYKLNPEDLK